MFFQAKGSAFSQPTLLCFFLLVLCCTEVICSRKTEWSVTSFSWEAFQLLGVTIIFFHYKKWFTSSMAWANKSNLLNSYIKKWYSTSISPIYWPISSYFPQACPALWVARVLSQCPANFDSWRETSQLSPSHKNMIFLKCTRTFWFSHGARKHL
jgi:hypothetical protein